MAMIIDFKSGAARIGAGQARASMGGTAEIVLFPGVRYERMADESAPDTSSTRRRRKRDNLELED